MLSLRQAGRHPGEKPHGRWPEHLLQDTPGLILIGALPGAVVIMSYAIENGFFPYLVGQVSTLQIVFTSAVIALVVTAVVAATFVVGIGIGAGSLLWFPILLTLFRSRRAKPHPLVPDGIFERVVWTFGSLCLFALLALAITSNLTSRWDHDPVCLAVYFLLLGLLLLSLVALHGRRSRIDWRLIAVGAALPLVLLSIVPCSSRVLLNLFMSNIGFRSSAQEQVLVDDDAHELLEERATFYGQGPISYMVALGSRTMWYLPAGIVIWRGPGDSVLIDPRQPGSSILYLHPDQVEVLPRRRVSPTDASVAGHMPQH